VSKRKKQNSWAAFPRQFPNVADFIELTAKSACLTAISSKKAISHKYLKPSPRNLRGNEKYIIVTNNREMTDPRFGVAKPSFQPCSRGVLQMQLLPRQWEWRSGLAATLVLLVCARWSTAEDWPQWRGPNGQGVSQEKGLPTQWSTTSNVLWKTAIPGTGSSSPIVSRGKVYLTTAQESDHRHPWETTSAVLVIGMSLAVLAWTAAKVWQTARSGSLGDRSSAQLAGRCAVGIVLAGLVAAMTAVLVKPQWFWRFPHVWYGTILADAELEFVETRQLRSVLGLVAVALVILFTFLALQSRRLREEASVDSATFRPPLARWMNYLTLLVTLAIAVAGLLLAWRTDWFWEVGQPWLIWLVSGPLALLALGAAAGWLPEQSPVRLVVAVVGLGLAWLVYWQAPLDEINLAIDPNTRAGALAPACLLLLGNAVVFGLARAQGWAAAPALGWGLPLLLAVLGLGLFTRSNYVQSLSGIERSVVCLDAQTGAILWQTPVLISPGEKKHALNTFATPTPATDGERIYAYFGSCIAAVDKDGGVLWVIKDPDYLKYSRYGTGSSVVVADDLLIVYRDREWQGHGEMAKGEGTPGQRPSALMALDKFTGQTRWSVSPGFSHDSYMTPLVWSRAGRSEVVVSTWYTLAGFDLKTGELSWSQSHPMRQVVPSLVVFDNSLISMGGNDLPFHMVSVSPPQGDQPAQTRWISREGTGEIPSPVCCNGLLFSIKDPGVLFCRDPADGEKTLWNRRLRGRFLASLVAGDGKVYAVNDNGETFVVAATRQANLVAANRLDDSCQASPAIANGRIYLRTTHHLYCIGSTDKPAESAAAPERAE
jgi:outer membrane protein assembly factor BamB